jgi:hypothetical protein
MKIPVSLWSFTFITNDINQKGPKTRCRKVKEYLPCDVAPAVVCKAVHFVAYQRGWSLSTNKSSLKRNKKDREFFKGMEFILL